MDKICCVDMYSDGSRNQPFWIRKVVAVNEGEECTEKIGKT